MEAPKTIKVLAEAIKAAHAQRTAEKMAIQQGREPIAGLSEALKAPTPPAVQGLK